MSFDRAQMVVELLAGLAVALVDRPEGQVVVVVVVAPSNSPAKNRE